LLETFGANFPLVGRAAVGEQLLESTASRFLAFQQGKHDNKLHPIPNCVGGPGVGKSRINQHGLQLMLDAAGRLNPPHALRPLLETALSLCVSYSNGMAPSDLDKELGGEAGLALRLLYRGFAEHDGVSFTSWVNRFDVFPKPLTLEVAVAVLRAAHEEKVPSGQVAFIYIGVDEFNSLAKEAYRPLLDGVVAAIGKAMSSPPSGCFIIGMLTGTASAALADAFDSSKHAPVRLPARLLSLREAEAIVDKLPSASFPTASWRTSKAFRRCLADVGGHPRALEIFLQESVSELSKQPAAVAGSLSLDFVALTDRVIAAINNKYEVASLHENVVAAVMTTAVLGDLVGLTTTAHAAHPEWVYRKLNDKGYLVLEAVGAGVTFRVRMPFLWLMVYLRRLAGLQHPLHAAFQPLRQFMDAGQAFWWQEWEDFNCQFLAFRINLLKLKHALLPAIMPSDRVTAAELFKGALVAPNIANRLVQLPPTFVSAEAVSGALSQRFPSDPLPKRDDGQLIPWDNGTVVVRNVAGGAADHFLVLLSSAGAAAPGAAPSIPSLVNCQDKYTERGDAFTAAQLQEEYDKCKSSVSPVRFSRSAEFQFAFALFANRPAAADLDCSSLPPHSVVVLAEQCGLFYGDTFVERAKFAATMTGEQLNVNTSGGVELRMWAGIGQAMAERILACRQAAVFTDWADLIQRVPRFPRTLQPRVLF